MGCFLTSDLFLKIISESVPRESELQIPRFARDDKLHIALPGRFSRDDELQKPALLSVEQQVVIRGLTRDEYRLRRFDVISRRETGLVEGEAGAPAGINKKQRLFQGHVAECFDEGHLDFMAGDGDLQRIAALVAEFEEFFGADVGNQVAERAVEGNDFTGETAIVEGGGMEIEADQLFELGADLGPIVAAGYMRADRRED